MVAEQAPSPAYEGFGARLSVADDRATLALRGEIDLAVEDDLRDAIDALLDADAPALEIDLTAVSYMDSTGVQLLLGAQTRAEAARRPLRLRLGEPARRLLLLCGVLPRFTLTF